MRVLEEGVVKANRVFQNYVNQCAIDLGLDPASTVFDCSTGVFTIKDGN